MGGLRRGTGTKTEILFQHQQEGLAILTFATTLGGTMVGRLFTLAAALIMGLVAACSALVLLALLMLMLILVVVCIIPPQNN
jgi:hypothetical protein